MSETPPNTAITDTMPLLSLENITVSFAAGPVVRDVSLNIARGEMVGLVGESGSGKSMTALSALRLVPEPGRITGKIVLNGENLLALPEKAMRRVRGGKIAMIFQDPMTSLNPVFTVGEQIAETVRLHRDDIPKRESWGAAIDALRQVHIPDPERRAKQFPHEMSGGMRQRVMIAMALACQPDVLLADEPTTALDVTVQAQILALIDELRRHSGMAVLLITHDLAVVAETCDRVVVLYGGQIMESAGVEELFARPAHPYTQGLLRSLPEAAAPTSRLLEFIPGQPPIRPGAITGCPFRARCPRAASVCVNPLPTVRLGDNHIARCHRIGEDDISVAASETTHA